MLPCRQRRTMRLRSSQFVFLLLLTCSVQHWEHPALHLTQTAAAGQTSALTKRDHAPLRELQTSSPTLASVLSSTGGRLDAAAAAAQRTVWTMRLPAQACVAMAAHTSFLRA